MRAFLITVAVLFLSLSVFGQRKLPPRKPKNKIDTLMIKRTGADPYGMKKYVLCILKTGPAKDLSKDTVSKLMAGHMKNMTSLENKGKLVVAGPFIDGGDWRGVFVFNVTTIEEAQKLTETDPAVKEGIFSVEFHPWYSSAVLMEVPLLHKKVQVKQF
jgi:uncharacterized protein